MRPAVVVTSFGVSASEAREKSLVPFVREIAAGFPEFTVVEAYTSAFIRRRLQEAGIDMASLSERLEELCRAGVREVYVQPTHLTPGEEYENKILKEAEAFSSRFDVLKVGEPVFFRADGTENDDIAHGLAAIFSGLAPQRKRMCRTSPWCSIALKRAGKSACCSPRSSWRADAMSRTIWQGMSPLRGRAACRRRDFPCDSTGGRLGKEPPFGESMWKKYIVSSEDNSRLSSLFI